VAKLISVNVGLPKDIPWKNRTVYTGAWKTPVTGRRMVRRLNIDGTAKATSRATAERTAPSSCINSIHTVTGPRNCVATTWCPGFWVRI
jgi:hypothetical protein